MHMPCAAVCSGAHAQSSAIRIPSPYYRYVINCAHTCTSLEPANDHIIDSTFRLRGGRPTEDPGLGQTLHTWREIQENPSNNIVIMKCQTRRDTASAVLRASVHVTVNIATVHIRIKGIMSICMHVLTCRQKWFELRC